MCFYGTDSIVAVGGLNMTIFVVGITSDIGKYFAKQCIDEGHIVYGTSRSEPDETLKTLVNARGGVIIRCDFKDIKQIGEAIRKWDSLNVRWDLFLSAVGILSPIGEFTSLNIDLFEQNIYINSLSQFRFLQGLLSTRNGGAKVFFLTSRGIHDPFPEHSAYCLSKLMLVKMCEILDEEIEDCSFIALNPGYIPTKIVKQDKGAKELSKEECEYRLNRVSEFIMWATKHEKAVVSGRNFFIEYDSWGTDELLEELLEHRGKYKLRRAKDGWNEKEKCFE